ncbi:MAG: amino acid synthesis family protein [Pseudomonadota bacterium]|nr:amino acid synthesis family protein [Pseudomonadota bacterium]
MKIRKIVTSIEEIRSDAGHDAAPPLRKVAVTAICENPCACRYVPDLSPLIDGSVTVGKLISEMAAIQLHQYGIQSYGKGAIVGIEGEVEHAEAVLTTPFGDTMRDAAGGGKAWICHMAKMGGPGTQIDIPLAHKDALTIRSHYDAMTICITDAPLPNEITVTCCYASGGRVNHRIGGHSLEKMIGKDGLR